jgi:SAM-dependent methyltransferase
VFTESAEVYDAIYFGFKDYRAEAAEIARLIRAEHPDARTILDVGCGTGEHARRLAAEHGFLVDGLDLDPAFLRLARAKHPAGRFFEADMSEFDLPDRYDAIICMFSSIGYVLTLPRLEQTLRTFRRHLAPGGILLVEPWFPPEKMTSGHHSVRSAEIPGGRVERTSVTRIEGRICFLDFDYVFEQRGTVRHTRETHELGLFTEEEMLQAFADAGLSARHESESPSNRGLYIARNAMQHARA